MRSGADVVVVGGGIVGCSVAAELAAAGVDVLLLEQHEIAHGASGRNHGLIFYPQNDLTAPLHRESLEMYRRLQQETSIYLGLDEERRGLLLLVKDDDDWQAAEKEARSCEAGGVAIERLDRGHLRAAEPEVNVSYQGGWKVHDGYRVDPAALTLALALNAASNGAGISTHLSAQQIVVKDGSVRGVATDKGIIECKTVVNATGPWASKLGMGAGLDIPVSGARGWLMLTRAQPPRCRHLLVSAGWHDRSWDIGSRQVALGDYSERPAGDTGTLIQQNRSGHILIGGSVAASHTEDPEGREITGKLATRAVEMVPSLSSAPVEAVWSGVRPVSPDGLPLIGWHPGVQGFFVAGGHGGQGIILGGGSGRLASQMITNSPAFMDPAPFSPARFV